MGSDAGCLGLGNPAPHESSKGRSVEGEEVLVTKGAKAKVWQERVGCTWQSD